MSGYAIQACNRASMGIGSALTRSLVLKQSSRYELRSGRPVQDEARLAGLSDEELAKRCRSRDHRAFTQLVDRYKDRIFWLVRRMVGSPDDEDLTQEVFLRVYRALPDFEGRSSLKTWIYRIAHNLCVSELEKRGRRGEHLSLEEEGEEKVHWLLPQGRPGLEQEIERRDISMTVRAMIERLPAKYRTVLTLFYLQQARYEEIAEIMHVPMGTVKTYVHRARLRLRDLVVAEGNLGELVDGADLATGGEGEVT